MPPAVKGEIRVNFIRDNPYAVPQADIPEGEQLLVRPYPADRIVGIAEQGQGNLFPGNRFFQGREIHPVAAVFVKQRAVAEAPSVVLHHLSKGIIDRLLDQHAVPRPGEGPHRRRKGIHHPRGFNQPIRPDLPSVMGRKPAAQRLKISGAGFAVSEYSMLRRGFHRFNHRSGCPKVHVRHPHGQDIVRHPVFRFKIVF